MRSKELKDKISYDDQMLPKFAGFSLLKLNLFPYKGVKSIDTIRIYNMTFLEDLEDIIPHHYLFFKVHHNERRKNHNKTPSNRTLFIKNTPSGITMSFLREIYSRVGEIEDVKWYNPDMTRLNHLMDEVTAVSGGSCHVIFKEKFKPNQVYSLSTYEKVIYPNDLTSILPLTGLKSWIYSYEKSFPESDRLLESINKYMKVFDHNKSVEDDNIIRKTTTPDESGFIVITPKKASKKAKLTAEQEQKQKKMELSDFYRFQVREAKRDKYSDLSYKFEMDKKRIIELKAKNYFNLN